MQQQQQGSRSHHVSIGQVETRRLHHVVLVSGFVLHWAVGSLVLCCHLGPIIASNANSADCESLFVLQHSTACWLATDEAEGSVAGPAFHSADSWFDSLPVPLPPCNASAFTFSMLQKVIVVLSPE